MIYGRCLSNSVCVTIFQLLIIGINNVIVAGIECESNNSDEIFSPKCSPCQDDLLLWKGSCVKGIHLNTHCDKDAECRATEENSFCSKLLNICQCSHLKFHPRKGYVIVEDTRKKSISCREDPSIREHEDYFVDPISIGILVVLALMFIVICVVLQMFSRAQFSENRSIFNTPNPRLMNVSLLKVDGRRSSNGPNTSRTRVSREDSHSAAVDEML